MQVFNTWKNISFSMVQIWTAGFALSGGAFYAFQIEHRTSWANLKKFHASPP